MLKLEVVSPSVLKIAYMLKTYLKAHYRILKTNDIHYFRLCLSTAVTGELYSWGYGVLGHGRDVSFSKTPRKIQEFSLIDEAVTRVFCGPDTTAVITGLYTTSNG